MLGNQSILDEFVHVVKSQVDSLTLKVSQYQSNSEKIAQLNVEIAQLNAEVEQLKHKDSYLPYCTTIEQLKHKNEELEKENKFLRETNTELNTKMKVIDNESLLTVITLLQSDRTDRDVDSTNASTNVKNSASGTWQTSKPKVKSKSKAQGNSVNEVPIKSVRSTKAHNHFVAETITSNSFDLLLDQNDPAGVIEINDKNTPSKCMSLNQQNSSNNRDSVHGEDRSTQTTYCQAKRKKFPTE